MTDETPNISDRAELSIFVRYVDSDTHKTNEEFLSRVEIIGSKGVEVLYILICEVLANKVIEINQMRFNGMDGTNTACGERSVLQRRLRHTAPNANSVNYCSHKLALVFVHLL